jgi:NHL repeat-containing protein
MRRIARVWHPSMSPLAVAWLSAALALLGAASPAAGDLAKGELIVPGPGGAPLNGPSGIALNPTTGEIIVANTNEHRIEIYTGDGRFVTRFTHRVPGKDGALVDGLPRGVAVLDADRLAVVDGLAGYVDIVDYRGHSIAKLATPVPASAGGLTAVAVARDGSILAAAPGALGRVYRFAPDLTPNGSWGEPGDSPGRLNTVVSLAELPNGNVVVASALTELAVQMFTPRGEFIRGFGKHDIGLGNFSLPSGLAVTADGRIWASDEIRHVIQVFDSTGTYIGEVGGGGTALSEFLYPSAVATDGVNHLAVAERLGGRIQVFGILARGDDPGTDGN